MKEWVKVKEQGEGDLLWVFTVNMNEGMREKDKAFLNLHGPCSYCYTGEWHLQLHVCMP